MNEIKRIIEIVSPSGGFKRVFRSSILDHGFSIIIKQSYLILCVALYASFQEARSR